MRMTPSSADECLTHEIHAISATLCTLRFPIPRSYFEVPWRYWQRYGRLSFHLHRYFFDAAKYRARRFYYDNYSADEERHKQRRHACCFASRASISRILALSVARHTQSIMPSKAVSAIGPCWTANASPAATYSRELSTTWNYIYVCVMHASSAHTHTWRMQRLSRRYTEMSHESFWLIFTLSSLF